MIQTETFTLQPDDTGNTLHMVRMGNPQGPAVLMIHGAIENGKIFYSDSGKGLAPFLAANGYDVFVADLRGKGKSTPHCSTGQIKRGQFETITLDIPAFIHRIKQIKGEGASLHLMSHSWGGVLLASWFARFGEQNPQVKSMVFFASKRRIYVQNPRRWLMVDVGWTALGSIATLIKGYLPARALRMGSDDEPARFYFECNKWVYSRRWIDPVDRFNYHEAFDRVNFPPLLSFTGIADHTLGNKKCVSRMIQEIHPAVVENRVLSVAAGNKQNYDHINILTHADAVTDHFPDVLNWVNKFN